MRIAASIVLMLTVVIIGCGKGDDEGESTGGGADSADSSDGGGGGEHGGSVTDAGTADESEDESDGGDVEAGAGTAIEGGEVELTPDNTRIVFIGSHAPPREPEPRTCNFTDFAGTATVEDGALTALEVTIQTEGIMTFDPMLTNHLRNADFFNVPEYPEAKFASTSIEAGEDGAVTITGDLTLLEETKPVTFDATVSTEDGLTLDAAFTIDRTEWGMDKMQEGVLSDVELQIKIGG